MPSGEQTVAPGVHEPEGAPAAPAPFEEDPVGAGAAADMTLAAAETTDWAADATLEAAAIGAPAAGAPAGGIACIVMAEDGAGAAGEADPEKEPEPEEEPEAEPEEVPGAEPEPSAAGAAAFELPLDDPPPHLGPVGFPRAAELPLATEAPGFGNSTSLPSAVVQSVAGMLALNISGKDASRLKISSEA